MRPFRHPESPVAELQAVMVEGIAHPGVSQPVRRQALVILAPDLLIFERIGISQPRRQVPRQGVKLAALLHVLDDDRQVGAVSQDKV